MNKFRKKGKLQEIYNNKKRERTIALIITLHTKKAVPSASRSED
jgi:hypothetical protein